jgi:hypothetical protein
VESIFSSPPIAGIPGWQALHAPPRSKPRNPPWQQQPLDSNVNSTHPISKDFFMFATPAQ